MANRKIGAVIALDGEQQFKSAVTACTRELNTMKSALKLVEAQTDGQAKSLETLSKKHDALNDVLSATKKRQDDVQKGFDHAQNDYERVGKQVEVYQRTLEKATKRLDEMKASGNATDEELKEQEELVRKLSTVVEQGATAYDKAGARVQDWEKKLNDAKTETVKAEKAVDEIEDEMREMATATDKAADQLDDYGDEAKDAAKQTDGLDISLKSMIKNSAVNLAVDAMRNIGDKAMEAAKYIVDVGSKFEAEMDKVSAISGATGGDLARLTEKAKEMGATTKFSASESAEAFEYMAMAGWKTNDMLSGIDGIMSLAAASGADLATTSDIVTDALTAFGESAGEAGRLADIMAAASSNSNTNVEMMGETFKYAAPVVGALGGSMEDTAVAVGLMANAGIKASQAGTSLRTGLTNLAKPTKQMQDAMDKYNIALVENEDGSVNLRETMISLREKMGGLEQTEQAAAAASIFGRDAMAGWLAVINASDQDFNNLITAIDNSEGAASTMADTMQNNLAGSMQIFKDSLEGLGIELYEKAVEPLTGAVEFATGVISGLTNLLKDSRTENELVIDQIKSANKELSASVTNANTIQAGAEATAGQIDILATALINLNKQENLDEVQKKRLKAIYDELVELVPEMAGYYNEETGKIDLTTEAVRKLTKARKDEIIEQGRLKALSDIYEKMGAAQAELQKATANLDGMRKQRKMWEDLRDKIGEAQSALNNTFQDMNKGPDLSALDGLKNELLNIAQAALNSGAITKDTYDEIAGMFDDNWSESELAAAYEKLQRNVEETDVDIKNAEESMGNLQHEYDNAEQTVKNLEESIDSHTKATREEIGAVDDSANSISAMTDEKIALKKATEDSAEATEKNKKATDEETTAVKNSGEAWAEKRKAQRAAREETENDIASGNNMTKTAQEEADALKEATDAVHENATAMGELRDAYAEGVDHVKGKFEEYKTAAENAFDINPFKTWKADTQKGVQELIESFNTQAMAFAAYKDNLNVVKENMGEISPEFVQYLQNMGESGYYVVEQLAEAFRNGDTTKAEELMNAYIYVTDIHDDLTNNMAINQMALSDGLSKLSPEAIKGWDDLGYAFDEGNEIVKTKGGTINGTLVDQFWSLINTSKEMGLEVPKGAAESIRNSDDPERAIADISAQMITRLQGEGAEWIRIADANGIAVDASIRDAIVNGTGDVENAVRTVKNSVLNVKPEFAAVGTEAGEAAGNATAEGITNKTGDIEQAASDAVDAAKKEGLEAAQDFSDVGEKSMDEMHGGVDDEAGAVATGVVDAITGAATSGETKADTRIFALGRYVGAKMITGIESRYGNMYDAGYDAILNAVNGMTAAMGKAQDAVSAAMSDIASTIANTQLNFPSIQIPHVRWTWEWLGYADGGGTYYPNFYVDWYAKAMKDGMILDNPTIFGMMNGKLLGAGEAGSEVVAGTSSLMNMIGDAVDDGLTSFGMTATGTNARLDALLDVVERYMPQILEAAEADREAIISDRTMGVIANRTSETIGRNARRLM